MNELERLAAPLVATPPISPTPIGELRSRAARRTRRRMAAVGIAALVVLLGAGTALGLAGRESPPVRVGTTPGTDVPGFDITIYLDPRATVSQIAPIEHALLANPNVTGLVYSTQADTYRRFECLFADQGQLLESVQPTDLPASFGVDFVGGKGELAQLEQLGGAIGAKGFSIPPGSPYALPTTSFTIPPGGVRGGMVYATTRGGLRSCPVTGTTLR
jgi:hypothetical protein